MYKHKNIHSWEQLNKDQELICLVKKTGILNDKRSMWKIQDKANATMFTMTKLELCFIFSKKNPLEAEWSNLDV